MNTTFLLFCMLVIVHIWASRALETVKLTAVTSFPELDQFYRDIKSNARRHIVSEEQTDDTTTKLQVCHFVFSSSFFDMNGEDPVKLNSQETYKLLWEDHRDIFHEIYGSGGATTSKKIFKRYLSFVGRDRNPSPPKYYDENHYRERKVWIRGYPTRESAFVCLTRERRTGNIKQYYVSKVYNVNKHISDFAVVAGCFIFTYDSKHDIVLRALAEEAAEPAILLFTTMERLYAYRRRIQAPARTAEEDPVCRLTKSEKLRLCNQIFSGSEFKDLIRFYPAFVNVEERCTKKRVDFDEADVRFNSRNVIYEEWMIGCKTLLIGEDLLEDKTFYVSTGYVERRVFVHGELDGHFYIIYYTNNISVWTNLSNFK